MLSRVLEPEVMDSPQEALDYDRMDHAEVNRRFVDDLMAAAPELAQEPDDTLVAEGDDAEFDDAEEGPPIEILDIGTGTALIPIELCRRTSLCRVVAADLAIAMLELARLNIEVANLTERIRPSKVDGKQLPYPDASFQIVMSNTIVHHIPDPRDVLRESWRVLAPGGLLFIRDLMRPADDASVERLVATYAGGGNDRQRQLFDQSLRAALTVEEAQQMIAELGLPPAALAATSDRHWTLGVRRV